MIDTDTEIAKLAFMNISILVFLSMERKNWVMSKWKGPVWSMLFTTKSPGFVYVYHPVLLCFETSNL